MPEIPPLTLMPYEFISSPSVSCDEVFAVPTSTPSPPCSSVLFQSYHSHEGRESGLPAMGRSSPDKVPSPPVFPNTTTTWWRHSPYSQEKEYQVGTRWFLGLQYRKEDVVAPSVTSKCVACAYECCGVYVSWRKEGQRVAGWVRDCGL